MSQSGCFVTIPAKKGDRFVTATLLPPPGLGVAIIPGCLIRSKTSHECGEPKDFALGGCFEGF
jgi:hypothetical protein